MHPPTEPQQKKTRTPRKPRAPKAAQEPSAAPPAQEDVIDELLPLAKDDPGDRLQSLSDKFYRASGHKTYTIVRNDDLTRIKFYNGATRSSISGFGSPVILYARRRGNNIEVNLYYEDPIDFDTFRLFQKDTIIFGQTSIDSETQTPRGVPFHNLRLHFVGRAKNDSITKTEGLYIAIFTGEAKDLSLEYSGTRKVAIVNGKLVAQNDS